MKQSHSTFAFNHMNISFCQFDYGWINASAVNAKNINIISDMLWNTIVQVLT
jgi:hypothetical protein